MDITKLKKVHIIGIGGIGISAVAKLLLKQGVVVTGSDLSESEIINQLRSLGADIKTGKHDAANLSSDTDLVIFTDAIPESNPEKQQTKKLNIESLSYFQFLGQYSANKNTIAISSTHGKTTTTAMTGLILANAGFDPTVIVGSKVKDWDGNLRVGQSDYFVVEADEYKAHMLEFSPQSIIINNIEHEHPDYYKDLNHALDVFQEFVNKLPEDGYFIYNLDDPVIHDRIEKPACNILSYAFENQSADLFVKSYKIDHSRQIFSTVYKGQELKDFNLKIPGKFNVSNALAAALLALELGVSQDVIKDTLSQFTGAWRRFEIVGNISNLSPEQNGAMVVSDYAHHPTEVSKTIQAAKEFYPDKRLVVVFQPHMQQRTKELMDDFVKAFAQSPADIVILAEIYDVAGRQEDVTQRVSSRDITEKALTAETHNLIDGIPVKSEYIYASDLINTKAEILNKVQSNDLVLIMGAGEIDKVARDLV